MKRKQSKLTREQVLKLLKERQGERSLRQFAIDIGISAAYLSDVYLGKRSVGKKILKHLGLERNPAPRPEPTYSEASA
jgi:transcriptional regulator with XRE-family HTH domain